MLAGILALVVAASGPALEVDASAGRHAISPDIYGMNFADPALAREIRLPVDRWGGNATEAYNWRIGATNLGNDWYFENIADCWDDAGAWCAHGNDEHDWERQVAGDASARAKTLLTLPMMGWVAKDAPLGHPLTCAFPRSAHPAQDAFDPYDSDCGNGRSGGTWVDSSPAAAGAPFDPPDAAEWVRAAAARGVRLFELGNEPMLWSETHHAFHPARTSYDELWTRSRDLAAAVKHADPSALTFGPAEWGWPNYFCSDADVVSAGCSAASPDRAAHGGRPLVEWYLDRMREYQQAHGVRLLDYFDLHYYAQGGVGTPDVTRSLWDPSYVDPSWIGNRIALIPRMRAWVDRHYPGTRLSLSEYDLTGDNDGVVDTLVQADTLGIFAREGLDLATRWNPPSAGQRQADAWRLFRDYDGVGGRFGSTYVRSVSADQSRLAVYGALRSDGPLTVVVINKTASALSSRLAVRGFAANGSARVYRWTGSGIARGADVPVTGGAVAATFPARSMTMLVLDRAVVAPPPPTPKVCLVPRLRGRTRAGARRAIRRAGCAVGRVRWRSRRGVRPGRVLSQRPRAGRRLRVCARVSFVVRRR